MGQELATGSDRPATPDTHVGHEPSPAPKAPSEQPPEPPPAGLQGVGKEPPTTRPPRDGAAPAPGELPDNTGDTGNTPGDIPAAGPDQQVETAATEQPTPQTLKNTRKLENDLRILSKIEQQIVTTAGGTFGGEYEPDSSVEILYRRDIDSSRAPNRQMEQNVAFTFRDGDRTVELNSRDRNVGAPRDALDAKLAEVMPNVTPAEAAWIKSARDALDLFTETSFQANALDRLVRQGGVDSVTQTDVELIERPTTDGSTVQATWRESFATRPSGTEYDHKQVTISHTPANGPATTLAKEVIRTLDSETQRQTTRTTVTLNGQPATNQQLATFNRNLATAIEAIYPVES
jgi:hypothetical protein